MITELILSGFFNISDFLLGLLPEMEWTVNTSAWEYVFDFMSMIAYLLPMKFIIPAIALIVSISVFRLTVALVKLILNFIPMMG